MDPDPGGLKPCGSCGSGSPTLQKMKTFQGEKEHQVLENITIFFLSFFLGGNFGFPGDLDPARDPDPHTLV
jgi:hypothetical protein